MWSGYLGKEHLGATVFYSSKCRNNWTKYESSPVQSEVY